MLAGARSSHDAAVRSADTMLREDEQRHPLWFNPTFPSVVIAKAYPPGSTAPAGASCMSNLEMRGFTEIGQTELPTSSDPAPRAGTPAEADKRRRLHARRRWWRRCARRAPLGCDLAERLICLATIVARASVSAWWVRR